VCGRRRNRTHYRFRGCLRLRPRRSGQGRTSPPATQSSSVSTFVRSDCRDHFLGPSTAYGDEDLSRVLDKHAAECAASSDQPERSSPWLNEPPDLTMARRRFSRRRRGIAPPPYPANRVHTRDVTMLRACTNSPGHAWSGPTGHAHRAVNARPGESGHLGANWGFVPARAVSDMTMPESRVSGASRRYAPGLASSGLRSTAIRSRRPSKTTTRTATRSCTTPLAEPLLPRMSPARRSSETRSRTAPAEDGCSGDQPEWHA
jgi:hypothetical protein